SACAGPSRRYGGPCSPTDGTGAGRIPPAVRSGGAQVGERGGNPVRLDGYPGQLEAHLDPAQRAGQGQVVEVAQVPDAEHATREPAEAGAEGHIELAEDDLADLVGVVPRRQDDGGQGRGVLARVGALHLQTPAADRAAGGL